MHGLKSFFLRFVTSAAQEHYKIVFKLRCILVFQYIFKNWISKTNWDLFMQTCCYKRLVKLIYFHWSSVNFTLIFYTLWWGVGLAWLSILGLIGSKSRYHLWCDLIWDYGHIPNSFKLLAFLCLAFVYLSFLDLFSSSQHDFSGSRNL